MNEDDIEIHVSHYDISSEWVVDPTQDMSGIGVLDTTLQDQFVFEYYEHSELQRKLSQDVYNKVKKILEEMNNEDLEVINISGLLHGGGSTDSSS